MMESISQTAGTDLVRTKGRRPGYRNANNGAVDRLPPHSREAERALLGCVMDYGPEGTANAALLMNGYEEMGLTAEWFYMPQHQVIFVCLREMYERSASLDLITVLQTLRNKGQLEEAGGIVTLNGLSDDVLPMHWDHYAGIVREKWLLRRLLRKCTELVQEIFEPDKSYEENKAGKLIEEGARAFLAMGETTTQAQEVTLQRAVFEVMPEIEDYHRGGAQGSGLRTGLSYLDKMLGGFGGDAGNYFVIGGRPGTGKTAWLVQVLIYLSRDFAWKSEDGKECVGVPTYLFSMEMKRKALAKRMIFQEARMNSQKWRSGFAESEDVPRVIAAAQELTRIKNLYLDDSKRLTMEGVCARARRAHRQYGIKCFALDYIQLLKMGRRQGRPDRVQEMGEISNELMALSGELNVPFIVLAQMNRDWEKESHRKPRMSDLKDCGDIEQDADFVGLMYQPKFTAEEKREFTEMSGRVYGTDWARKPRRVNLLLEKNRNGMTGDTELLFEPWCTRFEDWGEWLRTHEGQENLRESQMARDGGPEDRDEGLPRNEELGMQ